MFPPNYPRSFARALTLAAMFLPASLFAQTTWDGGGGDDLFGTSANWAGDSAPTPGSGNDLVFAGSTRLTPSNNYTAFDGWRNILFNSGAGRLPSVSTTATPEPPRSARGGLVINGINSSTNTLTVDGGATLGGTGSAGTVSVNGTFAPGAPRPTALSPSPLP